MNTIPLVEEIDEYLILYKCNDEAVAARFEIPALPGLKRILHSAKSTLEKAEKVAQLIKKYRNEQALKPTKIRQHFTTGMKRFATNQPGDRIKGFAPDMNR